MDRELEEEAERISKQYGISKEEAKDMLLQLKKKVFGALEEAVDDLNEEERRS